MQQPAFSLTDVAQDISAGLAPGCYIATLSIDSSAAAGALYATAATAPAADADYFPARFWSVFQFPGGDRHHADMGEKDVKRCSFLSFPRPRQGGLRWQKTSKFARVISK